MLSMQHMPGFALPCGATPKEREGVENVLKQAFSMFEGELKGKYYPLGGMSAEGESQKSQVHLLC